MSFGRESKYPLGRNVEKINIITLIFWADVIYIHIPDKILE